MPYPRYQTYQYETSPRKLQPEYEPLENPYKSKKSSIKKLDKKSNKTDTKNKIKSKTKVVEYLVVGFAILFAISYRNSLITESFNEKEKLKSNLGQIEKENEQLKINIENSLNLNNLEQAAKEMLGMQKLDNSQKVYISLPKKDYIEPAIEDVVKAEERSIWQKIINSLKK